jgi:hypothetical protein
MAEFTGRECYQLALDPVHCFGRACDAIPLKAQALQRTTAARQRANISGARNECFAEIVVGREVRRFLFCLGGIVSDLLDGDNLIESAATTDDPPGFRCVRSVCARSIKRGFQAQLASIFEAHPGIGAAGEHGMSNDPTMQRLDDQIQWYEKCCAQNQRLFKLLKIVVIVAAALIPFLAALSTVPAWVTGALGMLIAITEGAQYLNQYHANWISYRRTCETLKHEKYLYLGKAGPYAAARDPHALLAERIESVVSQEHAEWVSAQEDTDKVKEGRIGSG